MQPTPEASPSRTRIALGLIFSIMLMDIVGLMFLSPVASFIVVRYSDQALMVTMITVLYAAAQFFAAPMMGKLGDRYGRRPVLLVSLVGQAVGYIIFGIGGALWILFLGRIIGGITGGNLSTATAYIADVSKPEERARNFSLIGIAWSLGLIVGPAAGAMLGQIDLSLPAYAAAGLTLLNVLLGIFLLPESLPADKRNTSPMRLADFNPIVAIGEMARKPGLGWLLVVLGLFNFAFNGINGNSSLFFMRKFGVQPKDLGMLGAGSGLALAVVQFLLVQRVVRRFGERKVAVTSLAGQAMGDVAIFLVPTFWMIFPVNMLVSAISGFTFPTLTTLCTERVPHREVGLLMGVTTAIGSLMNIFGPIWGGLMFDHVMVGAPYWMGAVILLLAAALLYWLTRSGPAEAPQSTGSTDQGWADQPYPASDKSDAYD